MSSHPVISVKYEGYVDSYERLDYQYGGRISRDYLHWDGTHKKIRIAITIAEEWFISHKISAGELSVNFVDAQIPSGMEIEIGHPDEFGIIVPGYSMKFKFNSKEPIHLFANLIQVDPFFSVNRPKEISIKLAIDGVAKGRLFKKHHLPKLLHTHTLSIGPELGNTWVSFDPGTTGSCIAIGSETTVDNFNISLEPDQNGTDKIVPSVVAFKLEGTPPSHPHSEEWDQYCFVGEEAIRRSRLEKVKTFQSVKKLLGFKNTKRVDYPNGASYEFSGKELTQIICDHLYSDLSHYVISKLSHSKAHKEFLTNTYEMNARRAIVSVPNNFTLPKIRDMIDSIASLGQFDEIRYITEAKAVLCFYLYNYHRYHPNTSHLEDETVLIFDIGGATINTTISDIFTVDSNSSAKYEISVDAQIGYGIGGDTIDYCLAKYFFSEAFLRAFPTLKAIDPFSASASPRLVRLVNELLLRIKILLIKGYGSTNPKQLFFSEKDASGLPTRIAKTVLVRPEEINEEFNHTLKTVWAVEQRDGLPPALTLDKDHKLFKDFIHTSSGFPFFNFPLFARYIYQPVREALTDVLGLSEEEGRFVDTVILSGRSVLFPKIKEIIEKEIIRLRQKDGTNKKERKIISLKGSDLKTAVCKGACWYAINKGTVRFGPAKTTANFGFKETLSGNRQDLKFRNLIPVGTGFQLSSDGQLLVSRNAEVESDFAFDSNKLVFYQIMGSNPGQSLRKNEKHKFSRIETVKITAIPESIALSVYANDQVKCTVHTITGEQLESATELEDQEVKDENEEHYTWLL